LYASFLDLPDEGRHLRALHLELFTMPSPLTTFSEVINLPSDFPQKILASSAKPNSPVACLFGIAP
jgi:hypothetical protein